MNKIIPVIAATCAIFIISCKKEQKPAQASVFVVQASIGDASVQRNNTTGSLTSGQTLIENDIIITGKASMADILYSSEGVLRVNENSRVKISAIVEKDEMSDTTLKLEQGKVFASFAKFKKNSSFNIKTPTSIAAVRGTSFRVSSESGKSSIDVLSGKVKVNPVKNDEVIETTSSVIEANKSATVTEKDVAEISESKKEIAVITIKPSELAEIKNETTGISVSKTASDDIKKELDTVGIKSTEVEVKAIPVPIEAVKPAETQAPTPVPAAKEVPKIDTSKAERAAKEKLEKEKIAQALKEKEEKEEKEKREKLEKEAAERLKAEKAQEQKENRVKNIPSI